MRDLSKGNSREQSYKGFELVPWWSVPEETKTNTQFLCFISNPPSFRAVSKSASYLHLGCMLLHDTHSDMQLLACSAFLKGAVGSCTLSICPCKQRAETGSRTTLHHAAPPLSAKTEASATFRQRDSTGLLIIKQINHK